MGLRFSGGGFVLVRRVFVLVQEGFLLVQRVFVLDQGGFVLVHGVFVLVQGVFVLVQRVLGLRFWVFVLETPRDSLRQFAKTTGSLALSLSWNRCNHHLVVQWHFLMMVKKIL